MKKFLSVVLAVIIGALSVPFTAFAAENVFRVYEGVIVVSADASSTDAYASQRLKYYLDKIIGGDIQIVTDDTDLADSFFIQSDRIIKRGWQFIPVD